MRLHFRISAPVALPAEALNPVEDASWARSASRNASERLPLPQNTQAMNYMGTTAKAPTSFHSAELCDRLELTPRQKQMCVQGGEGLAETLLEG